MNFEDLPVISDITLFKAAHISRERGDKELQKLVSDGLIRPVRTPTNRVLLTPSDARRVYESLCGSPPVRESRKRRITQRGRAPAAV